jgi:D-tyrosyl-tRNA(Tyr) deacylase
VSNAQVSIKNTVKSRIDKGYLILLGIEDDDNDEDILWLCNKIVSLRIFNDDAGLMNLNIKDIDGEILLVSQFTLHAQVKKGNRPSFIKASKPVFAIPIYEKFIHHLEILFGKAIKTGEFGADMQVSLTNDGPVSIFIDSKNKE